MNLHRLSISTNFMMHKGQMCFTAFLCVSWWPRLAHGDYWMVTRWSKLVPSWDFPNSRPALLSLKHSNPLYFFIVNQMMARILVDFQNWQQPLVENFKLPDSYSYCLLDLGVITIKLHSQIDKNWGLLGLQYVFKKKMYERKGPAIDKIWT